MRTIEFMDQKVKDMSVKELRNAIRIKKKHDKKLTVEEEMNKFPKRFERLADRSWSCFSECSFFPLDSVKVLNTKWNHIPNDDNLFYVEVDGGHKEIVRRKK